MGIDPTLVRDSGTWNELIERSQGPTPFHRYEALQTYAEYSGSTLYPFVGYKGKEPIGLFPVYASAKGPLRLAVSPPPDLKVSYLGPVLIDGGSPKQRKTEKRHRRFVEAVLTAISEHFDPHYYHIRTGADYVDPRPFIWSDFSATPRYTYVVDLTEDDEELFMSFSSDARRNVRKARDEHEYDIQEGGVAEVKEVVEHARARHHEQGVSYRVSADFAAELFQVLPETTMRVYTCRSQGQFVGGTITLEGAGTVYSWQVVSDLESDIPAADLLDWTVMQRAKTRGLTGMDLVGANNQRLCEYKAKFDPDLRTHYSLERSSKPVELAKSAYLLARQSGVDTIGQPLRRASKTLSGFTSGRT